jgi:CheY-like chemotaxis protein
MIENRTSPTALVVDDNFFNRDLCALALRHTGYLVIEAENGREALRLLASHPFDLLLLDLAMPEMDGLAVMREIRQNNLYPDLCIMIMTANPHMAFHDETVQTTDYMMQKPIDMVAFSQLLERLKKSLVAAS